LERAILRGGLFLGETCKIQTNDERVNDMEDASRADLPECEQFGDDEPKDGMNVAPCVHCGRKIRVRKSGVFRHHLSNEPMYPEATFTRTCVNSEYPPFRV
jgi:hypothetical protein